MSIELRDFINEYMVFGDFIFRNPETHEEISRAQDLQSLQLKIFEIPDETLIYHVERNHFSKWLNARALFTLGELFKNVRHEDFTDVDELKRFLFEKIAAYRLNKARGIIAEFNRDSFDEYIFFSRIGKGSLGGKARGLAFIDSLIKRNHFFDKFEDSELAGKLLEAGACDYVVKYGNPDNGMSTLLKNVRYLAREKALTGGQ